MIVLVVKSSVIICKGYKENNTAYKNAHDDHAPNVARRMYGPLSNQIPNRWNILPEV